MAHASPHAGNVTGGTGNLDRAGSGSVAARQHSHHVRTLRAVKRGSEAGSTAGAVERYGRHEETRTPDLYRVNSSPAQGSVGSE